MKKQIAVIGAGIVGIQTARQLQRDGHAVTIFDPGVPAGQCSFGNAGYISTEEIRPFARPEILLKAPRMLLDPMAPLALRWPDLAALMPWFMRSAWAARPTQVRRGTEALSGLLAAAAGAWDEEIRATGLARFQRKKGLVRIYETEKTFASDAHERKLLTARGVAFEVLTGDTIKERIPGIRSGIHAGVHYTGSSHLTDPAAVARAIFDATIADGGAFAEAAVDGISQSDDGRMRLQTLSGTREFDVAVVAAGQGSKPIMEAVGVTTPIVAERGYHVVMNCPDIPFDMTLTSMERSFFITPMDMGLRLAGTDEFARAGKPESWRRADILIRHLRELFPGIIGAETSRWMGERPTLPDFLPAIGRAPGFQNLYCAYGHQHLGLTMSAITGAAIADLIAGRTPAIDLSALDPGRFS